MEDVHTDQVELTETTKEIDGLEENVSIDNSNNDDDSGNNGWCSLFIFYIVAKVEQDSVHMWLVRVWRGLNAGWQPLVSHTYSPRMSLATIYAQMG